MQSRSQQSIRFRNKCTIHPNKQIINICRSPFCGFYRELCDDCLLTETTHRDKFHLPIHLALPHVENRLKDIEKGILILKKQKEEKQKINPITLPFEVREKLQNIRNIINQKIFLFEKSLQEMYERQVNMKLQSLSETLKKSLDFLKNQQNLLQKNYGFHSNLKKYFINFQYWDHQRKYYKSYMQQILEKQVKRFKQGFDDDNIMKLIVSFEINLKSIFSSTKQNSKKQKVQRPHIFLQERNELKKYEIVQRMSNEYYSIQPQFLGKPYPKENYKWHGRPQSIYYPDLDCFFIFGQGRTQSNSIVKYQDGKQTGNRKISFIGEMLTKRSHFSTCLVNGQIFIIGGYNEKEGCMVKCEKMVVNQKVKLYLVSSLEQRSAFHSVCNYKDKLILKFGGKSLYPYSLENLSMENQDTELFPQIYDIQREQWRIVRYNIHEAKKRLQFGLQPLIIVPYQNDEQKIIVFANHNVQRNQSSNQKINPTQKKVFDIKLYFTRTDAEMKIKQGKYKLKQRFLLLPSVCYPVEKKTSWKVMAIDKSKPDFSLHIVDIKYQK